MMTQTRLLAAPAALVVALLCQIAPVYSADNYVLDQSHTAVVFKTTHMGLSWTYGRFKEVKGTFSIDSADPAKSTFTMAIKADSIDTDNNQRNDHLRSPDFFNTKQYPTITFKTTSAKPAKDGFEVTGDLTMHGVTRPVTMNLTGPKNGNAAPSRARTAYSTELVLRRADFGMDKMLEAVGDDVHIMISFEGMKQN